MAGIQNLKEAAVFSAHVGNLIFNLSNGLDMGDVQYAIPVATSFLPAFEGRDQIIPEFRDMDSNEAEEVNNALTSVFAIDDDDIEEFVEDSFNLFFIGNSDLSVAAWIDKWFVSGRIAKH